jgi:hypothetical protein
MRDTMTGEIYERNHLTHSSFAGYSFTFSRDFRVCLRRQRVGRAVWGRTVFTATF